jgi:hypothetical protein
MTTTKPIPPYKVAAIRTVDVYQFPIECRTYKEAYVYGMRTMMASKKIVAVLIFSCNTAIVIKRKWLHAVGK